MGSLEERKRILESRYARDAEFKFKVRILSTKLLAEWAADCMNKSDERAAKYIGECKQLYIKNSAVEIIIDKVANDLHEAGLNTTKDDVLKEAIGFEDIAAKKISNDNSEISN